MMDKKKGYENKAVKLIKGCKEKTVEVKEKVIIKKEEKNHAEY